LVAHVDRVGHQRCLEASSRLDEARLNDLVTLRRARRRTVGAAWQPQWSRARSSDDCRAQVGASNRADVGGLRLRAALMAGAVLLGLAAPPPAPAAWSPPGDVEVGGIERQRLQEVRGRLERRQALQATLRARVRALTTEVEGLQARRATTAAALASLGRRARVLEQRLDHLVPRLLAREAEVRKQRARIAHALAELASNGRRAELDSTARARMLAISPLMLERLRRAETGLQALRRRPERMSEQHSRILSSLRGLTVARQRLSSELEQRGKLQQVALARLRTLDTDVQLLADEQARFASRLRHVEAAAAARAGPRADEPALADPPGVRTALERSAAAAKGALAESSRLAPAIEGGAQILAAAPAADGVADPASSAGLAGSPTMPSPAETVTAALRSEGRRIGPSVSHAAISRATPLAVAFDPKRPFDSRRPLPLLPVPEELQGRSLLVRAQPDLQVPAAPGQAVAAPVNGKVVFAGRFKSYGLLLIIEHEREYHTLLWGFARLDVSLGEAVRFGQVVGIMGARGDDPPVLHVERRRNGRPISLAANSSGIQG
jgi:murein hydrolase activator